MKKRSLFFVFVLLLIFSACQKEDLSPTDSNSEYTGNGKPGGTRETILFSVTRTFTSAWRIDWPVVTGSTYKIRISGLYSDGGGANNLDAAFDLRGNIPYNTCDISIQSRWRFINKCEIRPDVDMVNSLQIYNYTYTAESDVLSFDFKDCCYGDNSGQLKFELILVSSTGGSSGSTINKGLIAFYPFTGNAKDGSGFGNNGTVNGAILTSDRFGVSNRAYSFNGGNSTIGIAGINNSSSNKFTISAWIKPVDISSNRYYTITRQEGPAANTPDWILAFQENGTILSFGLKTGNNSYSELDIPVNHQNIVDGKWHLVTAVYNGKSRVVYLDGLKIGGDTKTGNVNYTNQIGAIGSTSATLEEFFNGSIDELRIYNRALSANEISYLFTH